MWVLIGDGFCVAAGFALCWYAKDAIKVWVMGDETFISHIEDKIKQLRG